VDYVKLDNCNNQGIPERVRYPIMRDALNATGRPIFFSLCEWGVDNPATWAPEVGNSWRTTGDISANWNSIMRNANGLLVADPARFPSGIFNLAAYVHSKGLKFGLYSSAGTNTCAGRPASLNHEVYDALLWAAWEVDYIKLDNCNNQGIPERVRYPIMRDALNATGRPIFFSLCEWGVDNPATWAPEVSNSWRTTGDISANWNSIMRNANLSDAWWSRAHSGAWNDPDMLEVGNGGLTYDQNVAHFSLWTLIKSPLLLGNDLRNIPAQVHEIITNREAIAVSQDPLGVQGHKRTSVNGGEVWAGPLADGSVAVVLLNVVTQRQTITANWADIDLPPTTTATVRDLWKHQDLGTFKGSFSAAVNGTAAIMLRITPQSTPLRQLGGIIGRRQK